MFAAGLFWTSPLRLVRKKQRLDITLNQVCRSDKSASVFADHNYFDRFCLPVASWSTRKLQDLTTPFLRVSVSFMAFFKDIITMKAIIPFCLCLLAGK